MEKKDENNGFSLLEVLIAVTILGISFSVLIGGFRLELRRISDIKRRTQLSIWAENKMAEVASGLEYRSYGEVELQKKVYNWSLEKNQLENRYNRVILTVKWDSFEGEKRWKLQRDIYDGEN